MSLLSSQWLNYLPHNLLLFSKKNIYSYMRYAQQLRQATQGYAEHGQKYTDQTLFIAGLPKSGTSWLKKMLASYQGYTEVMLPEANKFEIEQGSSHQFDLPVNTFSRLKEKLTVLKLHVHASEHNLKLLKQEQIPIVILYRDLRDVAVSYYFYVKNTPWHPEHPLYQHTDLEAGLTYFAHSRLMEYVQWIEAWNEAQPFANCLTVRYEDLLTTPEQTFTKIAQHYHLDSSPNKISEIIDQNSFQRLSGGRQEGKENQQSFYRKGIQGDWKNQFTPKLFDLYEGMVGDFLCSYGYESF